MTMTERRLLLAAFILIFTIFSPLLVLYASGYRYNTRLGKIEQVGLLSLNTVQHEVTAVVNGETERLQNGVLLATLAPRDYDVVLSKDGYHPWSKHLSVEEGRTTFVPDVRLFLDADPDPRELFTNPLEILAENERLVAYKGTDGLVLYEKENGNIQEVAAPLHEEIPLEDVAVFAENTIVFSQSNRWFDLDVRGKNPPDEIVVPEQTYAVIPQEDALFVLTADRVWESKHGVLTPLFSLAEPQALAIGGDTFWIMTSEATHKRSFLYSAAGPNARPQFVASFPFSDAWQIFAGNGRLLTVHDTDNDTLFLVDTQTAPAATVTLDGVHTWQWSADRRALLATTDHELSVYTITNGTSQELITRQSEPITGTAWGPDESWVLFTTASGLYAAERDARGGRNTLLLAQKNTPRILNVSTSEILFSSQEGAAFVIWALPVDGDL